MPVISFEVSARNDKEGQNIMEFDARRLVITGVITLIVMCIGVPISRAYQAGRNAEKPRREGSAEIFTYSARTRHLLTALGMVCLVCAVGPLAMIAYKYLGTNPTLPNQHCCYHPKDDVLAGIGLLLGFGLGAYVCIVDPRKYYARLDEQGMTVRGLFSGLRTLRWDAVSAMKDYPGLQMVAIKSAQSGVRLWVPYTISCFAELVERLNEHNFFAEGQLLLIEDARAYLAEQGFAQAVPYKMFPPYLSFWRLAPESQVFAGVLMGVKSAEPWEKPYHEHVTAQGSWLDVMEGMQQKLLRRDFSFYIPMQQVFAEDFAKIIADRRKA